MTDIVIQWEDTRGIHVGTATGNENDGYCFTVGEYSGMHVGTDVIFYLSFYRTNGFFYLFSVIN